MDIEINNIPKLRFSEFAKEVNNDFQRFRFEDIFLFSTGKNIKQSEASPEFETPCVRYGELYHLYDEVILEVVNRTNLDRSELYFSEGNEVLLPSAGEDPLDIGSASALTLSNIAIGRTINILKPKSESLYSHIYVSYYINQVLKKKISTLAKGVSISNVYNSDLKKLEIILPTVSEQQKIAAFLTVVDDKIRQLTRKKELLEQYKKGVMQKTFKQEIRFKDDEGKEFLEWEEKKLGEYLDYKSERNNNGLIKLVLSVSNKKGFITQDEQFDGYSVASKNITNYKVVKKNEIAYNPSRINVGSIARLRNFDDGVVSPMYVVFSIKDELNITYFENLYKTNYFKYLIKVGCSGSVRDSLNFDELAKFKLKFPSNKEQQKIADFLSAIDNKIELVNTQLEKTQEFKNGLLQQMFV